MNETKLFYNVALTKIENVGPITAKTLVSYCGSVKAIFEESKANLLKIPSIGIKAIEAIQNPEVFKKAEQELDHLAQHKIDTTFYLDEDFPSRLKNFPDSPCLLYKKGNFDLNHLRTIGIVGTRKPSNYGRLMTEQIVEDLKEFDIAVISGLAHGIDATAHKSSIQFNVPTVGVMGGGFHKVYPAANRALAKKMTIDGAVITEFGFYSIADREHFPMRNRIIAMLSDATLVVESAKRGGSIITAEFANNYNKDVFALPGKSIDDKSAGCNMLIKKHKAQLIESAKDIAYYMGWEKEQAPVQMELPLDALSEEELIIVNLLKNENEMHLDKIHYNTGLSLSQLSSTLLTLEFKGLVKPLPGKTYLLSRK